MTLYNTIQRYTRLSKLRDYTRVYMTDYATLHNVMQHYMTLYKAIRYYTMLIIQDYTTFYRVYQKKRNLGISQEIDIVLKTKDFRRLGI